MTERASMIYPPIEELLGRVDSKFTLVSLAAKRGRQINSYFSQLGDSLGTIVPPQVASLSRKPLSIALEEIAADKVTFTSPNAEAEDAAAAGHTDTGTEVADSDADRVAHDVSSEHSEP